MAFDLRNLLGQHSRKRDAAAQDAEELKGISSSISFDQFVRESTHRPTDLLLGHDLDSSHKVSEDISRRVGCRSGTKQVRAEAEPNQSE